MQINYKGKFYSVVKFYKSVLFVCVLLYYYEFLLSDLDTQDHSYLRPAHCSVIPIITMVTLFFT